MQVGKREKVGCKIDNDIMSPRLQNKHHNNILKVAIFSILAKPKIKMLKIGVVIINVVLIFPFSHTKTIIGMSNAPIWSSG
jgi:hypothetical protein